MSVTDFTADTENSSVTETGSQSDSLSSSEATAKSNSKSHTDGTNSSKTENQSTSHTEGTNKTKCRKYYLLIQCWIFTGRILEQFMCYYKSDNNSSEVML